LLKFVYHIQTHTTGRIL